MKTNNTFFDKVYEVTRMVPHGRVTSYGAIASYISTAGSARMVGWALNNCHSLNTYVPAHRVVNRAGMLTGKHHFGDSGLMQQLLENEGAVIDGDRILNFNDMFWDPATELK